MALYIRYEPTGLGGESLGPDFHIGAIDSQPANSTGLALSGTTLSAQSADATHPGMVNNTTQTFSGAKTFTDEVTLSANNEALRLTGTTPFMDFVLAGSNNYIGSANALVGGGATTDLAIRYQNNLLFSVGTAQMAIFNASGNAIFTGTITASNFTGSTSGTNTGDVTLAAVGSAPSANGASLAGQVLTLQPADATHPGLVTTGTQTFAGAKTLSSELTLSATNEALQFTGTDPFVHWALGGSDNYMGSSSALVLGGSATDLAIRAANNLIFSIGTAQKFSLSSTAAVFTTTLAASNFSGTSSGTNTGDVTIGTANGLSLAGQVLSLALSSTSTTGALSSTDWNTFNNKQPAGSYITALTGDVTGTGPGSTTTTIASIQGTTVSGTTGTGNVVFSNSPTLVTPALGTPSALVGTNITGTAAGFTAGTVTTNANLTGPITSVGNATAIASQTGTGSTFVMSASPTITGELTLSGNGEALQFTGTNPFEHWALGGSDNYIGSSSALVSTPAGSATDLAIRAANNLIFAIGTTQKFSLSSTAAVFTTTLAASNLSGTNTGDQTITLTGDVTGSGTGTFATTVAKIAGVAVGTPTGTGNVVFSNSPTLVTPALGTPSALVGTNITGTAAGFTVGNATVAASATTVATTLTTTNASFFPTFVASTTNSNQAIDVATGLSFNPSTNNLTTTTFTGALSGNATTATSATTATTATNATNIATTLTSTNATFYPVFVAANTNSNQAADVATGLTFNPSTNTLTTSVLTATGDINVGGANSSAANAAQIINGAPRASIVNAGTKDYNLGFGSAGGILLLGDNNTGKTGVFLVSAGPTLFVTITQSDSPFYAITAVAGSVQLSRSGTNLHIINDTGSTISLAVMFIRFL